MFLLTAGVIALCCQTLCSQSVELVFTAHPTQALRRELLQKYTNMKDELTKLHNTKMSQFEKYECLESLKGLVQAAWRTDEIHRRKPTPQVFADCDVLCLQSLEDVFGVVEVGILNSS